MGINNETDIHSLDIIVENRTAVTLSETGPFDFGVFIQPALLFPNFLFPETSNFIIYDSVLRLTVMCGPFVSFSRKGLEIYAGAGMNFLAMVIRHNEQSEGLGNIYYERFELNAGAGVDFGLKFNFRALFLKLGGIGSYDFRRWITYTSKFADHAGWEKPLFEIRPFLIIGFHPEKGKQGK